jgi:hypothetical protein
MPGSPTANDSCQHGQPLDTALCEEELNQRYSRRIAGFFKESKLPVGKTLSSFDFSHLPDLDASRISILANDPGWVNDQRIFSFSGPAVPVKPTWPWPQP